jgi:hypothetical protein
LQRKRHQIINLGALGDLARLTATIIGKAHRRASGLAGNQATFIKIIQLAMKCATIQPPRCAK